MQWHQILLSCFSLKTTDPEMEFKEDVLMSPISNSSSSGDLLYFKITELGNEILPIP